MTPAAILTRATTQTAQLVGHELRLEETWRAFGRAIRRERRTRRIQMKRFAAGLGYTPAMVAMLETGKRPWPMNKAVLAVKLLTRREQWPQ